MAITSVRCPVLGAKVMRVTDLEGNVTKVICSEYAPADGTCRLRKQARDGGPLSQLLARAAENTTDTHSIFCALHV
jgi:hypothetical protein